MDEALAVLERDGALHLTQRCSERDLEVLEEALGQRLPADFRALLARVGGGILYDKHELFGGRRLMVHDIELVPDLMSVRRRLEQSRPRGPTHLIPIHRCGGELHLLDLSPPNASGHVVAEDGRTWPNLPAFLEAVVLRDRVVGAVPPDDPAARRQKYEGREEHPGTARAR